MRSIKKSRAIRRAQSGAALVIGLILLLVLTILAVSGMSAASLEFIMAGNEQYRQYAFQAAETGIQMAMTNGAFAVPSSTSEGKVACSDCDSLPQTYTYEIVPQLAGQATQAPTGSSLSTFSAYHFEVTSSGTSSSRNGSAVHIQGVYRKALTDDFVGQESGSASSALN